MCKYHSDEFAVRIEEILQSLTHTQEMHPCSGPITSPSGQRHLWDPVSCVQQPQSALYRLDSEYISAFVTASRCLETTIGCIPCCLGCLPAIYPQSVIKYSLIPGCPSHLPSHLLSPIIFTFRSSLEYLTFPGIKEMCSGLSITQYSLPPSSFPDSVLVAIRPSRSQHATVSALAVSQATASHCRHRHWL